MPTVQFRPHGIVGDIRPHLIWLSFWCRIESTALLEMRRGFEDARVMPNKSLQADKGKLSLHLHAQMARRPALAAELNR